MIEIREKLINASTGDVRPGNLLPVKLGDDVEDLVIDGDTVEVKYYYVQTPDGTWRKTEFYEILAQLFSITYYVGLIVYQTDYFRVGDTVTPCVFDDSEGYTWSGWIEEIPSVMPAHDVVIHSNRTPNMYNIFYVIDGVLVYYRGQYYNTNVYPYVPPEKYGYTFSGWQNMPATVPAHDITLTGTYVQNSIHTLTYMIDGSVYATETYPYNAVCSSANQVPDIETGYTWTGWLDYPEYMPDNDLTVNSSIIPNNYALDYYVDSSLWKSVTYPYNATIISETYTPPTGKQFSGWYNEPETMPAVDHYRVNGQTGSNFYTITFMSDDTNVYASYRLAQGDPIPELEIQKEGYVFLGWDPAVPQYMGDSSILTYAQFASVDCTVSWYTIDNNDKSTAQLLTTQDYVYGDELIIPEIPVRIGWDSSVLETESRVFADTDYYINYNRLTYQIYYYVDESLLTTVSYAYDASVNDNETAEKYGYTFTGWNPQLPSRMPEYDISTYAQFDINSYKIYFYVDTSCVKIETHEYNDYLTPPEDASKDGYNFIGWFPEMPSRMPANDFITYAQFNKISTVFWYIDSSLIKTESYVAGSVVNSPTPPEAGYVYDWNGYDTFTMGTEDVYIHGTKLVLDSSIFGISLEQYNESVSTPVVTLGYCSYTDRHAGTGIYYQLTNDMNLYGFIYPIRWRNHGGGYSWGKMACLPAVFGYQISSDGINWTDAIDIQFSTNVLDKTLDNNGIVHMPEFASFKYVRLVLKSITGEIDESRKDSIQYYGIVIGNASDIDNENSGDTNDPRSVLVADNTQEGCKYQAFGNYDSFYSLLQEQINDYFDTDDIPVHGLTFSIANNVCHAHRAYEKTAHNFITSGYKWHDGWSYRTLDTSTCRIETAPVNQATDVYALCYNARWRDCASLVTASELPATSLADECYAWMFYNCTSLVNPPELPATAAVYYCYTNMFNNCTSLVTAPALPATSLDTGCYNRMFWGCTSLVNPPELPATTVKRGSYEGMFYGCKSLVTAPALPATSLADGCYKQMFTDCKSLVTAPALPATSLADDCYNSMFWDCYYLVNPPELPATIVKTRSYRDMFRVCESLLYPPIISGNIFGDRACESMFKNCKKLKQRAEINVRDASTNAFDDMYSDTPVE